MKKILLSIMFLAVMLIVTDTAMAQSPFTLIGIGAKCLDVSEGNTANGTNVILWDCNGGNNQKWGFTKSGQLKSNLGKCLDVSEGSDVNGKSVIIFDCHVGNNQKWRFISGGRLKSDNGKCLDVDTNTGTNVIIWDCHDGGNQKWSSRYIFLSTSCKNIRINGSTLSASCKTRRGDFQATSINLDSYIGNLDGKLSWGYRDFSRTCGTTSLGAHQFMFTSCQTKSGILDILPIGKKRQRYVNTNIDLNWHITNTNGSLKYQ